MFAHGFNIRFSTMYPPEDVDVSMVAPKAPGHRVREFIRKAAARQPSCSSSGCQREKQGKRALLCLCYRSLPGRVFWRPHFQKKQKQICLVSRRSCAVASSALVKGWFETLVEAGYQPEVAYFECMHELKLIVDLMYRGGMNYMRYSVSDTAEHGDYTARTKDYH